MKAEPYVSIYSFNLCSVAGGSRREEKEHSIRRSYDAIDATLSPSAREEGGRNGHAKAEKRIDRIQQYPKRGSESILKDYSLIFHLKEIFLFIFVFHIACVRKRDLNICNKD